MSTNIISAGKSRQLIMLLSVLGDFAECLFLEGIVLFGGVTKCNLVKHSTENNVFIIVITFLQYLEYVL